MSVAALIADMVRAGVSADIIGRTAELLAQREPVTIIDEQAERRREADRVRKKEERLRKSADSADATPSPLCPPFDPPPISPQTRADDDAQASASVHLADQCLEAAGLSNDPKAVLWPIRPIANCIRDGAVLTEDVLPTIQRLRAEGRRFGSWAYPCQAIMDAKATREAPAPLGRATGPPNRVPKAHEQAAKLRSFIESAENEHRERQASRAPYPVLAQLQSVG